MSLGSNAELGVRQSLVTKIMNTEAEAAWKPLLDNSENIGSAVMNCIMCELTIEL
jgi:hypothetical protein